MCWDFQQILHFSAYEYFQWVPSPKRPGWRRKRDWREFMGFFDRLMNLDGTAIQESVLLDPDVVEAMANQKPDHRSRNPRIWGFTREVNLLSTLIEVQTRKPMKRPIIPGLERREQRKVVKLKQRLAKQFNLI